MKNPFKVKSIVSSAVAIAVGGGANVLADYAVSNIDALASLDTKTVNAVKIAVGAVGGSMVSSKKYSWLKSALDGIAIVGASNIINGLVNSTESTSGLPEGTIGRIRLGQRGFRPARRVSGLGGASFMEA